ncbi:MAG: hypothetical protein IIA83_03755 [Thaumarchaeota archaeon]|nr:hypothetical protein [Nitrososphaerota archaeon]
MNADFFNMQVIAVSIAIIVAILGIYWYRKFQTSNVDTEIPKWVDKNKNDYLKGPKRPSVKSGKSPREKMQEDFEIFRKRRFNIAVKLLYIAPIMQAFPLIITYFA